MTTSTLYTVYYYSLLLFLLTFLKSTRGSVMGTAEVGSIPGEHRVDAETTSVDLNGNPVRQKVSAVITERGRRIPTRAAVLTTGTFLGGRIFIGSYAAPSGRLGESAANGLTENLHRLGFTTGRLKTGTAPRTLKG